MKIKNNFYIFTGGPGSGKTTLTDELSKMGYCCVTEVGRKIIQEQILNNEDALPWMDTKKYSDKMLQYSIQDYMDLFESGEIYFFDRGIPDILGYSELINLPDRKEHYKATKDYRYNPTVFIFPPWKEIYKTDGERKQDFELAVATYQCIWKVYDEAGYNLIELPCVSVQERIDFILNKIN